MINTTATQKFSALTKGDVDTLDMILVAHRPEGGLQFVGPFRLDVREAEKDMRVDHSVFSLRLSVSRRDVVAGPTFDHPQDALRWLEEFSANQGLPEEPKPEGEVGEGGQQETP